MGYFRELPDLEYQTYTNNKNSSLDYVRVKNFFRRVKLRDDLYNVITVFAKYEIPDGSRPDLVAEEVYGSADLDWVVLLTAGIINVRDEWPLSDKDIYEHALDMYEEELNDVRFYETREVKDKNGRLILPKGKIVDSNFSIPNPDDPYAARLNPVIGISNYEYEVRKNDKKRLIYLLKPGYLQQFLNDIKNIMNYPESSQYVNDGLIRTENTRTTSP